MAGALVVARLRQGPSDYDLVLTKPGTSQQIGLMLDRKAKDFEIAARFLPIDANQQTSVQFVEWTYTPGVDGAGYSIETPQSYQAGACDWGEFVWLRRDGVAQPAGQLTELPLDSRLTSIPGARFTDSFIWPDPRDVWLTTRTRYMVKIPGGTDLPQIVDLGPNIETWGAALFGGAAAGNMFYVGNPRGPIQAYDGHTWSSGEAATRRRWLSSPVPYWILGDQLATGGASGQGGVPGYRLNATDPDAAFFYHVIGDPKVAANWSSAISIGDPLLPINSIASSNHNVWYGKGNGAHQCDARGYTPVVTEWFQTAFSPNNCAVMAYWGGMLWVAHEQGLMAIDPSGQRVDLQQLVQFGYETSSGPIFGRPRCFAPSPLGLYVGYFNGRDSYIGTVRLKGSNAHWSMAECVIRGQEVSFIREVWAGDEKPYLFVGATDPAGALHLYRQSLPLSGDPEQDALHGGPFLASPEWMLQLSRWNGGQPVAKTIRREMLEADRLGDANSADFAVSPDGGPFAIQGTATSSPRWTGVPHADYVSATSVQIRLNIRNAPDDPVIIRSAGVRYSPYPELTKIYQLPIIFGEGVPLKNGRPDVRDPGTVLRSVENFQRSGPVQAENWLGELIECVVEPGFAESLKLESVTNSFVARGLLTLSVSRTPTRTDEGFLTDEPQSQAS